MKHMIIAIFVLWLSVAVGMTSAVVPTRATMPPAATVIDRIAFGSCAFQWDEQKIWDTVIATKPDLFLYIGDAIYGDFDGKKVIEISKETY